MWSAFFYAFGWVTGRASVMSDLLFRSTLEYSQWSVCNLLLVLYTGQPQLHTSGYEKFRPLFWGCSG